MTTFSKTLLFCGAMLLLGCKRGDASSSGDPKIQDGPTEPRETRYENGRVRARFEVKTDDGGSYVKHGKYVFFYANGQKGEEGSYDLGKRIGNWVSWHDNGKIAQVKSANMTRRRGRTRDQFSPTSSGLQQSPSTSCFVPCMLGSLACVAVPGSCPGSRPPRHRRRRSPDTLTNPGNRGWHPSSLRLEHARSTPFSPSVRSGPTH